MPYFSDALFTNLTHETSVHLTDWPKEAKAPGDDDWEVITEMQKAREIVEKVHAKRKEMGIPVRQPLAKLQITNFELGIKEIEKVLLEEVNVKEVVFSKGKGEIEVALDTKITPELKEEAEVRDLVRKIQEERKKLNLNLTQKIDIKLEKLPSSNKLVQWMLKKAQIAKIEEGKFEVKKTS